MSDLDKYVVDAPPPRSLPLTLVAEPSRSSEPAGPFQRTKSENLHTKRENF